MDSVEGFILTGGQSRRMGTDKSQLTLNGMTFLERIAKEMLACGLSVTAVGSTTETWPHDTISDVYPNWGALGGVHAALSACKSDWAMVVACDFPFVSRSLMQRLLDKREGFEAVAPIQRDSIPQPLSTLYRIAPCLSQAEELIKSGERKPVALLQSVRTRWIFFDEIADLEASHRFFDNINSPEDYSRIVGKGVDSR